MWLCLAMILGPLALLIAWTFYQHKRTKANEYDQVGPLILKLGASGLMVVMIIACLSMGAPMLKQAIIITTINPLAPSLRIKGPT